MEQDDVIRGVRAAREAYCQQFGYDLSAIVRDLRRRELAGGRRIVNLPPRRPSRPGHDATARPEAIGDAARREVG
jgi:hypothetical protein